MDGVQRKTAVAGALCLVVGSVGQLAQAAVTPVSSGSATGAQQVARAQAHPGAMKLASWLDLGTPFFVVALVAVAVVAGAAAGSRLAWWGGAVGVATGLPGVAYLLAWDVLLVEGLQGPPPGGYAAVYDAYLGNPVVATATLVFLLGHVVSLLLLGIALWRSGAVPRWVGALLAAQPFLEIAGAATAVKPVTLVSYLALVVAFVACARALVARRPARDAASRRTVAASVS